MLFNRFLLVRFKDAGFVIGGRQELNGIEVRIPPTIEFDCQHTNESTPNEATIKLFNVAPETQKKLFVEGARVELEAGYWPNDGERDTGIIFKGQIREVRTSVVGGIDTVSELKFGDGDDAARSRRTRKTYPKGATHKQVVADVGADMMKDGIEIGSLDIPEFTEFRALTIDKPSWRVMEDICHQHDLIWSIQDGVFNVYSSDKALRDKPLVLTPLRGVLDAPEFTHDGVDLRTMMLHFLRPGFTFTLRNDLVRNRAPEKYRVEEINFSGSNKGDEFGAQIKAKVMGADNKVKRTRNRGRRRKP